MAICLGIFFILFPGLAHAQILINEVYPQPSTGESEWVELYNSSESESVDLTGWQLFDQLSSTSVIYSFVDEIIDPEGFLVVELSSGKLNNSGDGISLFDSNDNLIDEMSYNSSQTALSWSRSLAGNNNTFYLTTASPGESNPEPSPSPTTSPSPSPSPQPTPSPIPSPNPTASPTPSPNSNLTSDISTITASLQITEIMSCPQSGQSEWLELFNNSSLTLDISDWQLADSSSIFYTFNNLNLNPSSYYLVTLTSSKLNNSGDTLKLISPDGEVKSTINIPACTEKGFSFILENNQWQATKTSTPNEQNIFLALSQGNNEETDSEEEIADDDFFPDFTNSYVTAGDILGDYDSTNLNKISQPLALLNLEPNQIKTSQPVLEIFGNQTPIDLTSSQVQTKKGPLSVILGGSLLSGSSSWGLLRKRRNSHQPLDL